MDIFARQGDILKCLGEEEKRFHLKKETGPIYDLNQRLISELIQIPSIELQREDFLKVCAGNSFSESWKLLELTLNKGKKIFYIPSSIRGMQRGMAEGMIEDYIEASKEILLTFISQIQAQSPTVGCLKKEVPELDKFFFEIKYLQEDVDIRQIFEGKEDKIIDKLKNYPLAFEKCRADLKKKPKSGSTTRPKKS
jgi:hypothetical protein